jgi:hypothetical protein
MSSQDELSLNCYLRTDISQDVIDTLTYMTRSSSSENPGFQPKLKHDLFTTLWEPGSFEDSEDDMLLDDWRIIITNELYYDEELLSEWYGARFQDSRLEVRKIVHDDTFSNTSHLLLNWLASICESTGEVGYYHHLLNFEYHYYKPVPIYFIDGKAYIDEEGERIEL